MNRALALLAIGGLGAVSGAAAQAPTGAAGTRPRLVVAIAVDQLRADYMDRFRPFFGRSGFNLFLQRGAQLRLRALRARHHHHLRRATP